MYKVINRFKEKQHDNHIYEVNKPYPAPGKILDEDRADFLTKKHAEYGVAFLEKVEEKPAAKSTPKKAPVKKVAVAEKPAAEKDDA